MYKFENVLAYIEGEGLKRTDIPFGERILPFCDGDGESIAVPDDCIVFPGFIDEHIHGAGGADAMDAAEESLAVIADTIAGEGTTTFLATTMTQSKSAISAALKAVARYRKENRADGARLAGVHLEGPFISLKHKGAQPAEYVTKPSVKLFDEFNAASGNCIKIVTLAPEEEGAGELVTHLVKAGVVASLGHTGAGEADIRAAVARGARGVTHTYNAQSPLHHREIGTVGSALLYDELKCELIADTIHVSVPAVKLLVKCKPTQNLTLITDAMRAKGLPDGVSELGGQTVYVKNGEARLADGTLAGSVLKMNRAIGNLVEKAGVPLLQAVDYATANPAQTLGIYQETGSIRPGKKADFAVLDRNFDVYMTVRDGKAIYRKK